MDQPLTGQAMELMRRQQFGTALRVLERAMGQDPDDWNAWYLAGQCCRFLDDLDGAIAHLVRATELQRDQPPVFLALGIAYQLAGQWDGAIEALRQAIVIDPDYALAYNSLALTQKKRGELGKALHNYDAGARALARGLAKGMRNHRSSPILRHRPTAGTLWVDCAMYAALHLASSTPAIDGVAWPTGEQAMEEERTGRHGGLYWLDAPDARGKTIRLFLPNYFDAFREHLKRDPVYSNLIGNRGTVLELLGRHHEARRHFDEAAEFSPGA